MMPVHSLHGHTPNGASFLIRPSTASFFIMIWISGSDGDRFQCAAVPPSWDTAWTVVATWLVLTHRGAEGLKAWMEGGSVTISPTAWPPIRAT